MIGAGGMPRAARVGLITCVVTGLLLRLGTTSPLWLDESLSVNIARLPLSELLAALRQDGSPPLYYLLLHGWMSVLGDSDAAVRALSALFGLLTVPLVWAAGKRLWGPEAATAGVLLAATSPFAIRYATETRMYALVLLLVAGGCLLLVRALERPSVGRLAALALVAAALLYTHYWSLFLLVAVGLVLLVRGVRGDPRSLRCAAGLAAGGLLFVPWVPTLLYQAAHTGAPWAPAAGYDALPGALLAWPGGASGFGLLLLLLLALLLLAGVTGERTAGGLLLRTPVLGWAAAMLGIAALTLFLGITAGQVSGSAYASRYSAVALVPVLLVAARGATALPASAAAPVLVLAGLAGLGTAVANPTTPRTTADVVARAVDGGVRAGDVVAYCPDQLGPAVDRLLASSPEQVVFPTGAGPERVNWVDYQQRNKAADPRAFAQQLVERAGPSGTVWLVYSASYRTVEKPCERVREALARQRREGLVVGHDRSVFERPALLRYDTGPGAYRPSP